MTGATVRWHPPHAVLELVELVVEGALPPLDDVLARLGVPDLATLAARLGGGEPWPAAAEASALTEAAARQDGEPFAVLVEDAEGTPVARLAGGVLMPERPFSHPPLRAHRRAPGRLDPPEPGPALVAVVRGIPSVAEVDATVGEAAAGGLAVVWLVVVGAGRGPLTPEAAWRAAQSLLDRAAARGVVARVVPVAVPLFPDLPDDGTDPLPGQVAGCWARHLGGGTRLLADAVEPGYAREVARASTGAAGRRGVTVFFTGLSGSGKSTVAKGLAARLAETGERPVTLLDGDEVRRMLSAGLGFTPADRDLNVRRIGFVAAEVSRHGGLAVCAPIAPFAAVRALVRADVEAAGGELLLVHVATPLAECERRDRKGLYARARRGEVPEFTGISSPYEIPDDADLVLDTTGREIAECVDAVWGLLAARGHVTELAPERTLETARGG